jgi:hypothetical protein
MAQENEPTPVKFARETDIEAVAEAIELVDIHSAEHYAHAAIAALEARGCKTALANADAVYARLMPEIEKLREALKFYAEAAAADFDNGFKATAVLETAGHGQ